MTDVFIYFLVYCAGVCNFGSSNVNRAPERMQRYVGSIGTDIERNRRHGLVCVRKTKNVLDTETLISEIIIVCVRAS
jgi:hypothetical protein